MKLRVYLYDIDGEEVRALVNEDTKEVIVNGDDYHNHIIATIDGVLLGMKYALNKEIELEPSYNIRDNEIELIKQCGFDLL